MSLIAQTSQPTSPVFSSVVSTCFGVKCHDDQHYKIDSVDITLILSPLRKIPFLTRTKDTTPK